MEESKQDRMLSQLDVIEKGYLELKAKCERYEQLLQAVHQKAKDGIFPHLPVETMGAQKCVEIDAVLNEALSAREGEKEDEVRKQNIEAEITRRWNSIGYNPIGTRTRESYRKEVEEIFNQKEDKQ